MNETYFLLHPFVFNDWATPVYDDFRGLHAMQWSQTSHQQAYFIAALALLARFNGLDQQTSGFTPLALR